MAMSATSALAVLRETTVRIQPAGEKVRPSAAAQPRETSGTSKLGWELGTQAWTFRDRTCFEAIDTAKMLGLTCIELFPGQIMSKETGELKVGVEMNAAQRSALKAKLSSAGVRANSFGVVSFSTDEKAARAIFEFAKDMGMRGISCEPVLAEKPKAGEHAKDAGKSAWQVVDALTKEFGLYAAAHNHPKPSTYWDPKVLLGAIKGLDNPRLGACADTGHWVRSGMSPVECLKQYEGKIFELHFKDVKDDVDHPWGTGGGDAKGQMVELKRQGFKGPIFVEYETGEGKELEENVAKCIAFFDRTAKEIG